MPRVVKHGHTHRFRSQGGTDPAFAAHYEIKVFADGSAVTTGDGAFIFAIPDDVGGCRLSDADAFVTTTGTGTTVQVRNVTGAVDMLSTRITIDSGETTSYTAAAPPVINQANAVVAKGDLVAIDVDVASGEGLGIILEFS